MVSIGRFLANQCRCAVSGGVLSAPTARLCIVGVLIIAVTNLGQPARAHDLDNLSSVIRRVKRSVVGVGSYQKTRSPPARLLGTGFAAGDGRLVVTNDHVAAEVKVGDKRGEQLAVFVGRGAKASVRRARVLATDVAHDLAMLEIDGAPLPALEVGDSRHVQEGEFYVFSGFPIGAVLGLYPVSHHAMISAISPFAIPADNGRELTPERIRGLRSGYNIIQLDAVAYPGNSGSPLYHPETGEVMGVINKVFVKRSRESALSSPSGITYAIPSQFVAALLREALTRNRK